MNCFAHIFKCKNVPEFTKREVDMYKRVFSGVRLHPQKIKEICQTICKRQRKSNLL